MKYTSFHPVFVSHRIDQQIDIATGYMGCTHEHALNLGPYTLHCMESATKDKYDIIDIPEAPEGFWAQRMNVPDIQDAVDQLLKYDYVFDDAAMGEALQNSFKFNNHVLTLPSCKMVYLKDSGGLRYLIMEHLK